MEDHWAEFERDAVGPELSAEERAQMRLAFDIGGPYAIESRTILTKCQWRDDSLLAAAIQIEEIPLAPAMNLGLA